MGWKEYATAGQFRDLLEGIVVSSVNRLRPAPKLATVLSTDYNTKTASVLMHGTTDETDAITVRCSPSEFPRYPGDIVQVGGVPGDLWVIRCVSRTGMHDYYETITARSGIIWPYAGSIYTIPYGWILCDGASLDRDVYPFLFTAIGTTWGEGSNPGTTFAAPDGRGRFLLGAGTFAALGVTDGAAEASRTPRHTHSTPNHTHTDDFDVNDHTLQTNTALSGTGNRASTVSHTLTGGITSSGSGTTGQNAADSIPYAAINWIIKV
jgi:microcystin-dependent protein